MTPELLKFHRGVARQGYEPEVEEQVKEELLVQYKRHFKSQNGSRMRL